MPISDAARAKVERILSDVLAYTTGKFDFEDGVLPKGAVDLKLATERLVMAAVRRVTDRAFVLRHIDGLAAILGPTSELVPRLSEVEGEAGGLPQHLDGRRTLKEAAASARLEEFEAAKIASGLMFLGLVERVQAGVRAGAAPMTFADVEAETENELDLGATAAQAFSSEPAVVVPEPEPSPPQVVTPEADDEPPPFVIGEAAAPATSSSAEIAFPSFAVPEPEPTPVFAAEPAYQEPPVIEPAPKRSESPTVAMSAPPMMAAPEAEVRADEPLAPAVTSSASPLPLIMPEKGRPSRPRASIPEPPSAAPPREPILSAPKSSRPSKEDLAALDHLLNSRNTEGPLTPLEKPGGYEERSVPPQYPRSGGGRIQRSRAPLFLGLAAVLLAVAAGGWYYVARMGGQLPFITTASAKPPAATTPVPVTPATTLAPVVEAPSTVAAVPTTVAAARRRPCAAPPTSPRGHPASRGRDDPEAGAAHGRSRRTRAAACRQLPGGGESVRDLDTAGGQERGRHPAPHRLLHGDGAEGDRQRQRLPARHPARQLQGARLLPARLGRLSLVQQGHRRPGRRARVLPQRRRDAEGAGRVRGRPLICRRGPLAAAAAAALWLACPAAHADTITLTNGRVIEADRAWYEGTQLRYEKNGNVFGLPKSLVQSIDQRAAGATQSPEVAQARERLLSGDPAGAVRLLRGVLAKGRAIDRRLAGPGRGAARDGRQRGRARIRLPGRRLDDHDARSQVLLGTRSRHRRAPGRAGCLPAACVCARRGGGAEARRPGRGPGLRPRHLVACAVPPPLRRRDQRADGHRGARGPGRGLRQLRRPPPLPSG